MNRVAGYFVAGVGAVSALLLLTLAIPVLAAHAHEDVGAADRAPAQFVNRALKGDQLPMASDPMSLAPDVQLVQPKRLVAPPRPGCPDETSQRANPFATEIPGRCVA
jgi:hypothetical protein